MAESYNFLSLAQLKNDTLYKTPSGQQSGQLHTVDYKLGFEAAVTAMLDIAMLDTAMHDIANQDHPTSFPATQHPSLGSTDQGVHDVQLVNLEKCVENKNCGW